MQAQQLLAEEFETHRPHLRAVAYRMLGSTAEAEDAVQESWLRLTRADADAVANMRGWLTTVVGRVCLDMLRTRQARGEAPLDKWPPELLISTDPQDDPEREAELADSIALALLVVLESLNPSERLAFVLHDMFGVPFEEIAEIVERSPAAARQLASRARRRVRGAAPPTDADLADQRRVVDAFLAAARAGDFEGLLAVLDPDVVFRIHAVQQQAPAIGSEDVAHRVLSRGAPFAPLAKPALVNGGPGLFVASHGRIRTVLAFSVVDEKIVAMDLVVNPNALDESGT